MFGGLARGRPRIGCYIRAGLRTIGFERRATVAFTAMGEDVIILRVLYAGRSIELAFGESH